MSTYEPTAAERLAAVARDYFAAREVDPEHLKEALRTLVTEDFVWRTTGYPDVCGLEAMIDLVDRQVADAGYARSSIDIVALAVGDGFVLTERVDTVFNEAGDVLIEVALMGRLDIRDDGVCAHRDYVDDVAARPVRFSR